MYLKFKFVFKLVILHVYWWSNSLLLVISCILWKAWKPLSVILPLHCSP